jgi:SPX domain protein involved in polyphosphate accumulation|tara:strand:+ start:17 stop:625 length:609 start_codon:yes stop_codon:yes gene_type:complete
VSYRKEKKYRVTLSEFQQLKTILLSNGMEPLHNSRKVSSIYFDNKNNEMFSHSEEGVLLRKKVRIRWYDERKEYTLEKKVSSIEGRFKTTTALEKISSIDAALQYIPVDQHYGVLSPTLKVSYERTYFSLLGMRITFDTNINYQDLRLNNRFTYKDPERVVEIKVPLDTNDDFIEKIVPYPTARFSKYCRGLLMSQGHLSAF